MWLIMLALMVSYACAQSELDTLWSRSYDLSGQIFNVTETPDFGIATAGTKYNSENQSYDIHFAMFDYWGRLLLEQTFGDSSDERATRIATFPDGALLLCGHRFNDSGERGTFALKLTSGGDSVWFRNYPVPTGGVVSDVVLN